MGPGTPARNRLPRWPDKGPLLAAAFLLAALTLLVAPNGFGGGHFDDQRYLEGAREWLRAPPLVGDTHWELRHTLTLPLAAWFALFGESLTPFRIIPAFAWLALLGVSMAALARFASVAAALVFAGLFATTQLFHQFGTRYYPEIFELLFVSVSLWSFYAGSRSKDGRGWLLLAGLSASLAMLTRETSFYLPLLYAGLFAAGRPVERRRMLWLAAGAAPLLLVETVWLWAKTGEPMYRAAVALGHVTVPTDQMEGEVYRGGVLFNPELASRWRPVGTFEVHWAVNPILNLFADIRYGLLFWLAAGLWLAAGKARREPGLPLGAILLVGVFAFAFATYMLMVPQRSRYYGLLAYAATLVVAVLADRALIQAGRRRLFAALAALQLIVGLALVGSLRRDQALADLAVPMVASVGERVYAEERILARLNFPLEAEGLAGLARPGRAPPGGIELSVVTAAEPAPPGPACCWQPIAQASAEPSPTARAGGLLGLADPDRPPQIRVVLRRRMAPNPR